MNRRSVRISESIDREIQLWVKEKHYFKNMGDFMTSAVRTTYLFYKECSLAVTLSDLLSEDEVDPHLSSSRKDALTKTEVLYRSMTLAFMKYYSCFEGSTKQITFDIPGGLSRDVRELLLMIYGFDKRTDFYKVSIATLLLRLKLSELIKSNPEDLLTQLYDELVSNVIVELISSFCECGLSKDMVDRLMNTIV